MKIINENYGEKCIKETNLDSNKSKLVMVGLIIFVLVLGFISIVLFNNRQHKNVAIKKDTVVEKLKTIQEDLKQVKKGNLKIKEALFQAKNKAYILKKTCEGLKKDLKVIYNLNSTPIIKDCIKLEKYKEILEDFKVSIPEYTGNTNGVVEMKK